MRFTQDSSTATHLIRGYAAGELRIDNDTYRETVLVSPSTLAVLPEVRTPQDLLGLDRSRILTLGAEIVLLGTGDLQVFPPAAFRTQFLSAGIGFEVMTTGAACRTFNVLAAEQRRVVAVLLV
jgi:uncharacterized protein